MFMFDAPFIIRISNLFSTFKTAIMQENVSKNKHNDYCFRIGEFV